ncbi:MAG: peroxiredoxin [Gammaproteobacteria bacterium]|nr:peroxiredoxin [Gammaproteobacteria bacterium]
MTVLIGNKAPDFTSAAVLANGEIKNAYHFAEETRGKYVIVFFYPLDFTFVCPSELIALDHRIEEFNARDTIVLGVSIDSQFTHNAWRKTPIASGGIGPVRYPLIADVNHHICQSYNVEHPTAKVALRGAFLIDREGIVRAQVVNDLPLGRNIDELLRLIDALQFHEKHGEVCPAGWMKGKTAIKPDEKGIASYLAQESQDL